MPQSVIDEDDYLRSIAKDSMLGYLARSNNEYSMSIDPEDLFSQHNKAVLRDFSWLPAFSMNKRIEHKARYFVIAEIIRRKRSISTDFSPK